MTAERKTPQGVPMGLVPTPFHDRLEALSHVKAWTGWAGQISPLVLDTLEFEYFALRNQCTLFDISPMKKYRVTGPDAEAVLNRMVTRDLRKLRPGRVAYALWCDEEGMVIDDGTVFRFGPQDFRLCCQEPMYSWLLDAAWGFDAQVTDESDDVAALALQGPTSFSLLQDVGLAGVETMRPFDLREVEPGLWISRTGFTGDLGYELWCAPEAALPLWDRLWQAGRTWGLRAVGYEAVNLARIEAGFIAAGVEFQPVHATQRLHRGRTPMELGMARLVDFDKGHFNGRRALLAARDKGPRSLLVRAELGGYKPATGALVYHRKRREAGHVTSAAFSPSAKRNIAMMELKAPYGTEITDDLWAEIYVHEEGRWERRLVPVTLQSDPFYFPDRARATPPRPY